MNWVFMNSLQRQTADGKAAQGQVTIGEDAGVWHVYWTETAPDGAASEECWYEGTGWSEMLKSFRGKLLEKMSEGYAPLLGDVAGDVQSINGRVEWVQKLQYYGEVHKNEAVFEALRDWRRTRASRDGKAAYMIGTNRLLAMLSAFLPQTEEELAQIPGFGKSKIALYGKDVLAITAQAQRTTEFPLDWVEEKVDYAQYKLWLHREQEAYLERERQRKAQRNAVLEAALNGTDLDTLKKTVSLPRRDALTMLEDLEKEGYDVEPVIRTETQQLPPDEQAKVLALFGKHGDRYLKPVYQEVSQTEPWTSVPTERAYEWLRLLRLRYRRVKVEKEAETLAG